MAQLEMFAHHAVALAPMTLHLLDALRPGDLVDAFCTALRHLGPLARSDLDWDGGRVLQNWAAVRPYVTAIAAGLDLRDSEAALVSGTLAYERHRAEFAGSRFEPEAQRRSLEFWSGVDIPALIRRIQDGDPLDDTLLCKTQIVFRRSEAGRFHCFAG